MSTNTPNSCTSIRTENFNDINFFNVFFSMLTEEESRTLKDTLSAFDVVIAFNGSKCLNGDNQRGASGSGGNAGSGSGGNAGSGSGRNAGSGSEGNAPSGASINKNTYSRDALVVMVPLVFAIFTFDFEA